MLTNIKEIEIISQARQKNVRDPNRSRKHFENIFEDFFLLTDFKDSFVLDLGPGQYDFCVLAKERGAIKCCGIDNDPAVIELGQYKGFEVIGGRLQDIEASLFRRPFDGVFCKFSINAFWFHDDTNKLVDYIARVDALVKPKGWAWIAPWNGVPKAAILTDKEVRHILEVQNQAFEDRGYRTLMLDKEQTDRYGVSGQVANNPIFLKNL